MKIPIKQDDPINQPTQTNHAFWHTGFRPFFCLATLFALIVMPMWLMIRQGWHIPGLGYYGLTLWHVHEMVFGYGLAVMAGFLLTAIKNWTGIQTAQLGQLQLLVSVWVLGRLVSFIPGLDAWLMALSDSLFALFLVYFVAKPLIQTNNRRNYKMFALVGVMAGMNVMTHVALMMKQPSMALQITQLALMLIILLIGVMAGRVFPMFSQNGVAVRYQAKTYVWLEKSWPIFYLPLIILMTFFRQDAWSYWPIMLLALMNAGIHGWRLTGWYNQQIWRHPLIWVLHVGYAFLVLGFLALAVSVIYVTFYFLALHFFTMGCLSLITLGMMARVSFGHSGRDVKLPPRTLFWCFLALVLATMCRVILPVLNLFPYQWTIVLSVIFWVIAFGLFFSRYLSIWWQPRIDGKPG